MTTKELDELDTAVAASSTVADDVPADDAPEVVADPEPKPSKPFKEIVLDSQEAADKFIQERVARAERSAEKKFKDQVAERDAKIKAFEEAQLSADELKEKRIKEAEDSVSGVRSELTKAQRENLVIRAAVKAGLPEELWDRVRGDDPDSIAEDIEKLSALVPAAAPVVESSRKPPVQSPSVRVAPTGDDPEPEPDVRSIVDSISGFQGL